MTYNSNVKTDSVFTRTDHLHSDWKQAFRQSLGRHYCGYITLCFFNQLK